MIRHQPTSPCSRFQTAHIFVLRRASELWVLGLVTLLAGVAGCEVLPIDEIDRCGVENPPEDCSCADNEAEMMMDLGVRSASCPECLQSPRHPDCENEGPGKAEPREGGSAGQPEGSAGRDGGSAGDRAGAGAGGSTATTSAGHGGGGGGAGTRHTGGGGGAAGAEACTSCDSDQVCLDGECVECDADEHCKDEARTLCDREAHVCVQCLAHADCASAGAGQCKEGKCVPCRTNSQCAGVEGKPYCIMAEGECVACRRHSDCAADDAAQCDDGECVPCSEDAACAGHPDRTVCDDGPDSASRGQCVQCTGTKYASCARDDMDYVCNSREHTCSETQTAGTRDPCQTCVSDAHCRGAGLCMPMTFGDSDELGTFCLEPRSEHGNDCGTLPQFRASEDGWTSLDGVSTVVCKPRLTTCRALTGFDIDECSGTGEEGDAECGVDGLDDGVCRPYASGFRCSYPCTSAADCADRCEPLQSNGPKSCTFP